MKIRQLPVIALIAVASPAAAQRAPAPTAINLPPDIVSLACAPSVAFEPAFAPIRITGSQEAVLHHTFAPGDLITINAGTDNGIEVGQEYYARRDIPRDRGAISRENPALVQTSGWIRVYAVDRQMSLATIVHGCGALELGDYLVPFALPTVPAPLAGAQKAQRDNYGRVLTGTDKRTRFAKGDYFVVDRGSDHGVILGAQFIVYVDKLVDENFLFERGQAVAVEVTPETSTLRVTNSRDGISVGDYVAIRK